jgi:hypothetical protein
MSASPESLVPKEPGASTSAGIEATQEVQAQDTLPQEGVNETEAMTDDEDDAPRPRLAFPPRPDDTAAPATLVPTVHAEEDEDSDEDGLAHLAREDSDSDSEDGEEAYVPATSNAAAKIPKFKKNKKSREDDDVGTNREKKQKQKKSRKPKEAKRDEKSKSQSIDRVDEDEDLGTEPQYDEATRKPSSLHGSSCGPY